MKYKPNDAKSVYAGGLTRFATLRLHVAEDSRTSTFSGFYAQVPFLPLPPRSIMMTETMGGAYKSMAMRMAWILRPASRYDGLRMDGSFENLDMFRRFLANLGLPHLFVVEGGYGERQRVHGQRHGA